MFADIAGFTPLADRLDPEQLMEVVDPILQTLTKIVGKYDGYIEKFGGDALLALFGAPIAHDDDAHRALLVAQEMHDAISRMQPDLPPGAPSLSLHIGINSGHAIARVFGSEVRMDYAVLGDAIILAQRLEATAPHGQTYVGESTYELTRATTGYEFVGELTLKGISKPAKAWRLLGDRRRSIRSTNRPFVARERELAVGERLLDAVASRTGAVFSVTGAPGLGKSRLLQEIRQRAHARGFMWVEARCASYGSGVPYWPLIEMARRVARIQSDAHPADSLARLAAGLDVLDSAFALPYVARLLALPHGDADAIEPEGFKRGLHAALAAVAGAIARRQPLLIALEDVHWADASTTEAVADLVRGSTSGGYGLYLSSRPEGQSTLAMMTRGADETRHNEIELEALDEGSLADLVEKTLGGIPPPELLEVVTDRSGGNPLFAHEIVRALRDAAALERREGRWKMRRGWDEAGVPLTIEGVLSSRIDLLPHSASAMLQLASVIGRQVRLPLLWEVADIGDPDASLEQLLDSGLLERVAGAPDTVTFHHALVQEVSYNRLLRKRRRSLHLKVAEAAERLYGDREETVALLAQHLYLGGAGARAVPYLVRAGELARHLFANQEAAVHFARAAELAPVDAETIALMPEILINLGDVQELRGQFDEALSAYREALDYSNDVRAFRGMSSALRHKSDFDEGLRVIDEAFASLGTQGPEAAVLWLERGWTLSLAGRYAEGNQALRAGLGLVGASDDRVRAQLLVQLGKNEAMEGNVEHGLRLVVEAHAIADKVGDLEGAMRAMRILGGIYGEIGRFDESVRVLQSALPLAERLGRADEIAGILLNLGMTNLDQGAVDEAISLTQRAADEFERIEHGHGLAAAQVNLGEILLQSGRYDEALQQCAAALELARTINYPLVVADAKLTMAKVNSVRGNDAIAAELADEAAALFGEMGASPAADRARSLAGESRRRGGEELPDRT